MERGNYYIAKGEVVLRDRTQKEMSLAFWASLDTPPSRDVL
jgi:hypothetical protein